MPKDYYEILKVPRNADTEDIKRAFRRLAKIYHPDVNLDTYSEEKFKEINEAYKVLSDENRRSQYDRIRSADFNSRGEGDSTKRKNEKRREGNTKNQTYAEQKTGGVGTNDDAKQKDERESSSQQRRAETPRRGNMGLNSSKNTDGGGHFSNFDYRTFVKIGFVLAIAVVIILFVVSPQVASFFLTLSRAANHDAHNEILASFLDPRPTSTPRPTYTSLPTHTQLPTLTHLPTSTPRPTYTPLSTHTKLPTLTPLPTSTPRPTFTPLPTSTFRPTYTPIPTSTPLPPAFVIDQLDSQAHMVTEKRIMGMREFHVGVSAGACSHGGDFTAQGVIEAGIDFDQLDEDRVTYDSVSQTFTLKLPAAELTSCRIEYIRLETNSFSMCSPDWDRARIFAEAQSMWQFLNDTDVEDMLDKATRRSEEILGDFVQALTGKRVKVISDNRVGKPVIAESCDPVIPGGWRYNKAQNIWERRR